MLPTTIEAIKAILKADPAVPALDRNQFLNILRTGFIHQGVAAEQLSTPRLLRRRETAHLLSRSVRAVDQLAVEGVLVKRKLPGRKRAAGFLESDVLALIRG